MGSGGARPGAGRKAPNGARVTLSVRIKKETKSALESMSGELGSNKGRVIDSLVENHIRNCRHEQ